MISLNRHFVFIILLCLLPMISFGQDLKSGHIKLEVTLTDGEKNPLSDKTVVVVDQNSDSEYKGKTNEKGKATVQVPKGESYQLVYRAVDGPKRFSTFKIPDRKRLNRYNLKARYSKGRKEVFTLENVYFDTDKATLRESSYDALNDLYKALATNEDMRIEIAGHTDDRGKAEYNKKLSQRRAESVKDYLVNKGISSDRIRAKGYGESEPIASNESEQGRQKNRRTEVRILEE